MLETHNKHVIVFDLDETLGFFQNFGLFYYTLQNYMQQPISFQLFCDMLDLYPELLRPKIFSIIKYILDVKEEYNVTIMIYTNNQGPKEWVQLIKRYFEYKLNRPIFTKIIYAFMINGRVIEPMRSTHNKTYRDLLRTTRLPKEAKICFIDDVYYDEMTDDNVYYLDIVPYVSSLHYSTMVERLVKSKLLGTINQKYLIKNIANAFINVKYHHKTQKDYEIDIIIGKTIMMCLQEFFLEF
uniref:FCP1 homology domain-containing protein n=1 Tax=viral metagenome TaxID=1070528 RepID=A0A6C0EG65_9ZZZZ